MLLTLAAEVAIAYLDLRELDAELEIARRTAEAFQGTYELFDRRLQGGAASALETARAEAALGEVAAQIPEIERAIVARENQINFLLGRSPRPIAREGPSPTLPPDVPPGLPSLLLERRPDIRQAEQLLVAANANVGVAKAGFFPRISLTGLFGNVSPELSDLFSHGTTWSIGAGLVGPLFQGGRIRRGHEAAIAQWDEARIGYEAAVVNALGEVSGALVDRAKLVETERQRGAGGRGAPRGRAPRERPLRLRPLGLLRGARGAAAAVSRGDRPRAHASRPARGGGGALSSAGRGLEGGGSMMSKVVTGASSGLGGGLAARLADRGMSLDKGRTYLAPRLHAANQAMFEDLARAAGHRAATHATLAAA